MRNNLHLGKNSSLLAQVVAAIWIAGWSGWLIATTPQARSIGDVVFSGLAIAACFTPVYFSIIMDKVQGIFGRGDRG